MNTLAIMIIVAALGWLGFALSLWVAIKIKQGGPLWVTRQRMEDLMHRIQVAIRYDIDPRTQEKNGLRFIRSFLRDINAPHEADVEADGKGGA